MVRLLGRNYWHYLGFAAVAMLVTLLLPVQSVEFDRSLIASGQWWRLISGNLAHTNSYHMWLNLAGLMVLASLHGDHFSKKWLVGLFIGLALATGMGLFVFAPNTERYVGLSGMLHGLFVIGAVADCRKGWKSGYLLLLGVAIKVGYEQTFGASPELEALIHARVATESHLIGALSGALAALLWWWLHRHNRDQHQTAN